MPRRLVDLRGAGAPLLDIVSHARPGVARRDRLSQSFIEHITLTVRRAPEVMVKVLTQGQPTLNGVRRHLDYLRLREEGELEIETDDGRNFTGKNAAKDLTEEWDLALDAARPRTHLGPARTRSAKLVHKVVFSMPAGTPPGKVLEAVKNFAREEFALKHRYAMVLHTDEPHPHVHLVVKAMSEQGERLHIRKETLRGWRREFAQQLRALGVAANATERAVRGNSRSPKLDGIYRAEERGACRRTLARIAAVNGELSGGRLQAEPGRSTLLNTRREVEEGWRSVSQRLVDEGHRELAAEVDRFVSQLPPPRTDREQIAESLRQLRQKSPEVPKPERPRTR